MAVRLHVGLGLDRLVEAEDPVDRQPELAGLDRGPEILAHAPDDLADLLDRAGAEGDADIVDAAGGVEIEVELALRAAEPADIDDAAEHARRFQVLVGDAGRDLVDDEIDAVP